MTNTKKRKKEKKKKKKNRERGGGAEYRSSFQLETDWQRVIEILSLLRSEVFVI